MNLLARIRQADPRLRITLIATALLIVPQVGQFVIMRDLNAGVKESGVAVLFMMALVFIIPTSIILSGATIYSTRKAGGDHRRLQALAILNIILALSITWFFVSPCTWSAAFALTLAGCH
jgi:hypothetical protein